MTTGRKTIFFFFSSLVWADRIRQQIILFTRASFLRKKVLVLYNYFFSGEKCVLEGNSYDFLDDCYFSFDKTTCEQTLLISA